MFLLTCNVVVCVRVCVYVYVFVLCAHVRVCMCVWCVFVYDVCKDVFLYVQVHTVDRERFTGLNIHGFSTIKVFAEIFSCCLGHKQCISTHYLV